MFFLPKNKPTDLDMIFSSILEYLGGLKPLGLGAGGLVCMRRGVTCPLISFSVSNFDIAVFHLSLTRAESGNRVQSTTRERGRQPRVLEVMKVGGKEVGSCLA